MNEVKKYFGRYALIGVFILLIGSLLLNFFAARDVGRYEGQQQSLTDFFEMAEREKKFIELVEMKDEMYERQTAFAMWVAKNYGAILDEYSSQKPERDETLGDLWYEAYLIEIDLGLSEPPDPNIEVPPFEETLKRALED